MSRSDYFLFLFLASVAASAQVQDTFKVETSSVVVDVIVTDKRGHHVPGLLANDFTVLENGVPQKLESFSENRTDSPSTDRVLPAAAVRAPADAPIMTAPHPHLLTVVMDLADS